MEFYSSVSQMPIPLELKNGLRAIWLFFLARFSGGASCMHTRASETKAVPQTITSRRGATYLAAIVLVLFYGFVLLVAFKPALLGQPVSEGARLTVGVSMGLFMFVFFWVLTALYVRRANNAFDRLTAEIVKDAESADLSGRREVAR